jgi:hypothetical protein
MKKILLVAFIAVAIIPFISSGAYADDQWPESKDLSPMFTPLVIAGNFDVNTSTSTATTRKGRDGAACSGADECKSGVCEGGSCCTDYGASCDSASHCCGHQSCTKDGTCPK